MEFKIPEKHKKAGGVYVLRSSIDSRFYVGSAVNFYRRYLEHCRNNYMNAKFRAFVREHGWGSFTFELLELTDTTEDMDNVRYIPDRTYREEREGYWIKKLQATTKGWNVKENPGLQKPGEKPFPLTPEGIRSGNAKRLYRSFRKYKVLMGKIPKIGRIPNFPTEEQISDWETNIPRFFEEEKERLYYEVKKAREEGKPESYISYITRGEGGHGSRMRTEREARYNKEKRAEEKVKFEEGGWLERLAHLKSEWLRVHGREIPSETIRKERNLYKRELAGEKDAREKVIQQRKDRYRAKSPRASGEKAVASPIDLAWSERLAQIESEWEKKNPGVPMKRQTVSTYKYRFYRDFHKTEEEKAELSGARTAALRAMDNDSGWIEYFAKLKADWAEKNPNQPFRVGDIYLLKRNYIKSTRPVPPPKEKPPAPKKDPTARPRRPGRSPSHLTPEEEKEIKKKRLEVRAQRNREDKEKLRKLDNDPGWLERLEQIIKSLGIRPSYDSIFSYKRAYLRDLAKSLPPVRESLLRPRV